MFRTVVAACGAAALASLTMAAQTPPPQTPKFELPKTVTFTGCLNAWDAKKAGSGSEAGAPAGDRFLLTNAMESGGSASEGTLVLVAGPDVKIAAHVNHKVEVTGMLQSAGSAMGKSTPETGTPSENAAMKAKALTVTALKMVSATCP